MSTRRMNGTEWRRLFRLFLDDAQNFGDFLDISMFNQSRQKEKKNDGGEKKIG